MTVAKKKQTKKTTVFAFNSWKYIFLSFLYFYSLIEQNGQDCELLVRAQCFWVVHLSTSLPLFLQRYHLIKTNWQSLYWSVTPRENRCATPGSPPRPARIQYILPSPGFSLLSNCSFFFSPALMFSRACHCKRATAAELVKSMIEEAWRQLIR